MYAPIPALGALPWAPERGHVSTGYELPNSLPSVSLQQLQAFGSNFQRSSSWHSKQISLQRLALITPPQTPSFITQTTAKYNRTHA